MITDSDRRLYFTQRAPSIFTLHAALIWRSAHVLQFLPRSCKQRSKCQWQLDLTEWKREWEKVSNLWLSSVLQYPFFYRRSSFLLFTSLTSLVITWPMVSFGKTHSPVHPPLRNKIWLLQYFLFCTRIKSFVTYIIDFCSRSRGKRIDDSSVKHEKKSGERRDFPSLACLSIAWGHPKFFSASYPLTRGSGWGSCQLKFRLLGSCQLNFRGFVSKPH